ncbi:MAG: hypothetical protein WCM76_16365 [Bacteroidota bacterium]
METVYSAIRGIFNGKVLRALVPVVLILLALQSTAVNYYWVGGAGNWSSTSRWSLTSGGSAGTSLPGISDNVFFDGNSGFTSVSKTVTVDVASAFCQNMDWTGALNTPTFASSTSTNALKIYGSLKLITGMTYSFTGPVYFEATSTGQTITSAGKTFPNNVYLNGIGGEWTLLDDFRIQANASYSLTHNNGIFRTNGKTVYVPAWASNTSTSRGLYLSNSIIEINSGTWSGGNRFDATLTNMTLDAGTSTFRFPYYMGANFVVNAATAPFSFYNIEFTGYSSGYQGSVNNNTSQKGTFNNIKFFGNGAVSGYNEFMSAFTASYNLSVSGTNTTHYKTIVGGTTSISGANTIDSLVCNSTTSIDGNNNFNFLRLNGFATVTGSNTYGILELTKGATYTLQSGYVQTITGSLNASGSCGGEFTLKSSVAGSPAMIYKSAGTVTINYAYLDDISATGGATFTAYNTTDLGGNIGWTIYPPAVVTNDYYWIAGAGSWSDGNHWSLTSGGVSAGGCIPGVQSSVFFDANSGFTTINKTVTIDVAVATCKSMDWTGSLNTPTFATTASTNVLKIYGSFKLITGMTYSFTGPVYFEATSTGQTITSAGKTFPNNVYLNGIGGEWTLLDDFRIQANASYSLTHNNGIFRTNGKTVYVPAWASNTSTSRGLYLYNECVADKISF